MLSNIIADILPLIRKYIADGATYKSFILASKLTYGPVPDRFVDRLATIALMIDEVPIDERVQLLPLDKLPEGWKSVDTIRLNKFVTTEFVIEHRDVNWSLSRNVRSMMKRSCWMMARYHSTSSDNAYPGQVTSICPMYKAFHLSSSVLTSCRHGTGRRSRCDVT